MTKQVFEADPARAGHDAGNGMDAAYVKIPFDVEKVVEMLRNKQKGV